MHMLSENDSGTFRRIFSDFIVYTYWAVKVFQILNQQFFPLTIFKECIYTSPITHTEVVLQVFIQSMLKKHSIAIYRNGSNKFDGILGVIFNLILYMKKKTYVFRIRPQWNSVAQKQNIVLVLSWKLHIHTSSLKRIKFTCVHVQVLVQNKNFFIGFLYLICNK